MSPCWVESGYGRPGSRAVLALRECFLCKKNSDKTPFWCLKKAPKGGVLYEKFVKILMTLSESDRIIIRITMPFCDKNVFRTDPIKERRRADEKST